MKDNPTLIDSEFLKSLNSNNTRIAYQSDLEQFIFFMNDHKGIKDLKDVKREHILDFRNHLNQIGGRHGEPSAPYTVARKLSAIKSYFSYLVTHKGFDSNPYLDIPPVKRNVKNEHQIIGINEIEDMIISTSDSKAGPLHAAIIALNFYAMIRLNEYLSAKIEDFYNEGDLYFLKVKTKGNKFQIKEIPYPAVKRLLDYFDWMKSLNRDMHPKNYLFRPSRNNHQGKENIDKPLNPRTVNRILDKYAKKTGILKRISSHCGRATAITNYLTLTEESSNVADIYGAKSLAGHSKISTTEIYDKKRRENTTKGKLSGLYNLNITSAEES